MGNKKGRTRLYHPDMCDELIKMMDKGMLNCEIYAKWDISEETFYRWINDIPDFKQAYLTGLPKCEASWCEWGRKGMQGQIKGFSFNSWIAFMNNKFKWAKNSVQDQGSTTNNITISNMNVLQQKSSPDLIKYITNTINKHQDIVDIQLIEDNNDSTKSQ